MDLFPSISSCQDRFDSRRHSFETLSPDLDSVSGTSSSGDSPELPDYYSACLSFIHDVLMEEEELDDGPVELPDYDALQATEKSFYDALSEPHPSSSDQIRSFVARNVDSSKGQVQSFPFVIDTSDYSSGWNSRTFASSNSFEDDVVDPVVNFLVSTSLATRTSRVGSSISINQGGESERRNSEEEKILDSERRARKIHQRDDDSDWQDVRSNKLPASYNDEESEEIEQYEYILLRKDEKDDFSGSKDQSFQCKADAKPEDDSKGKTKGSRTRRSRLRIQNGGEEVVDLRTLLNSCAQAVANFDISGANDLLKQIRAHSSPYGDSIQRVAHYFANGLEARMVGTGSQLYFNIVNSRTTPSGVLKCYQRYISAIPVNRISFFLANQMIAKLAEDATHIHVIDFGIYHGFQWPSLIQQLSERPNGPPRLKITGIDYPVDGFRPAEKVEQTGLRLKVYCERFNVPFEYHAIAQAWETIKPEDIKIERGEVVVVNSHYRSNTLLDETVEVNCPRDAFLRLIRNFNPDLFIHGIVNGSYSAPFFVTRFREAVLNFISMFDMIEATMPREDKERQLIEQDLHGKEILNIVANEGMERVVRPETYKLWQVRTQRAGFRKHPLDKGLVNRAKDIVKASYHKDYLVDVDNHWMIQGWKGRILFAISCWKPKPA